MSLGRKLFRSSAVRTSQRFLQIAVALVMTPVIVHALGDRMYGFWVLVGAFLGYYGLLDLGLSSAVSRFLSRASGMDDKDEANSVVNTSLAIYSIVGAAVLALSGVAAVLCGWFIHDAGEAEMFKWLILLLGTSVAFSFPMRVFGGVLDANLRHDLTTYASIIRLLVSNAFIWFLLRAGHGIYALAVVSFFGGIAEYAMLYAFARRVMPEMRIRPSLSGREMVRQMFGYSGKTFVAQMADVLRFKVDSFVIAGYLGVSQVTHYSVGARLVDYFAQIMVSAVGMLAPVFSQYEGKGDFTAIRKGLFLATKVSVMLSVFIGLSILFYGKQFIQRWMGADFGDSYVVVAILTGAYIFAMMQMPSLNMLYGISKHHYFAAINTGEGVLNLVLSLVLVKYYGIYGVAMGTAISMALVKILVQPYFVCRTVDIRLSEYYMSVASWTAKSALPIVVFMYFTHEMITADYGRILVFALLQTVVFSLFSYVFILEGKEKSAFKAVLGIR